MKRMLMGLLLLLPLLVSAGTAPAEESADRPNLLWITCEDMSANLGCYGDAYARSPNIDRLAREGIRYDHAYVSAPVCTPTRSGIITGVHAISLGTQHLRRWATPPSPVRCFPEYLRETGYYCSNNSKEDYNFRTPKTVWDESSGKAHWRNRPKGKPFFSIFNFTTTHQSQTRYAPEVLKQRNDALPEELRHDPAKAPLPPYYPDTPEVRNNVAAYYTQITLMDRQVGELLGQLKEDGLDGNTIVFFYSDHGAGLPRGKRWLHDNGIRIPLLIRFPEKYRKWAPGPAGTVERRIISTVDLAPTMLSLADLPIPEALQGSAFLGARKGAPREWVFAARDRVDEEVLCSRTIHTGRYQYIRNFHPHRARMPLGEYSEITPIRKEIRRLAATGKLKGDAAWLAAERTPAEELYDLDEDPHEMKNLAKDPKHRERLIGLRILLMSRMEELWDTGMLPETELCKRTHNGDTPPYEVYRKIPKVERNRMIWMMFRVGMGPEHLETLVQGLQDASVGVRIWSAMALAAMGSDAAPAAEAMQKALDDSCPSVQTALAEALCRVGNEEKGLAVLMETLQQPEIWGRLDAATALYSVRKKAAHLLPQLRKIRASYQGKKGWDQSVRNQLDHVISGLER